MYLRFACGAKIESLGSRALPEAAGDGLVEACGEFVLVGDADAQVLQQAVAKRVDPAVDCEALSARPGIADDGGLANIGGLFDDVQLAQAAVLVVFVFEGLELRLVLAANVLHVAQPVVDETQPVVAQCGEDTAAAVVPADDDVLDAQDLDGKLNRGKAVEIGVDDDVGDVAMDEHLAGQEADNLVGRHPAVGATDPQIARGLLSDQPLEELRIVPDHVGRPGLVIREKMIE